MLRSSRCARGGSPRADLKPVRGIAFALLAVLVLRTFACVAQSGFLETGGELEGATVSGPLEDDLTPLLAAVGTWLVAEVVRIGVEIEGREPTWTGLGDGFMR